MFTFGIFSTHLPYVAFVVFYAYFLLFGINKASNGEIVSGEKIVLSSYDPDLQYIKSSNECCSFYDFLQIEENTFSENAIFKRKWKHQCNVSTTHYQFYFVNSLFCRPPPAIV